MTGFAGHATARPPAASPPKNRNLQLIWPVQKDTPGSPPPYIRAPSGPALLPFLPATTRGRPLLTRVPQCNCNPDSLSLLPLPAPSPTPRAVPTREMPPLLILWHAGAARQGRPPLADLPEAGRALAPHMRRSREGLQGPRPPHWGPRRTLAPLCSPTRRVTCVTHTCVSTPRMACLTPPNLFNAAAST